MKPIRAILFTIIVMAGILTVGAQTKADDLVSPTAPGLVRTVDTERMTYPTTLDLLSTLAPQPKLGSMPSLSSVWSNTYFKTFRSTPFHNVMRRTGVATVASKANATAPATNAVRSIPVSAARPVEQHKRVTHEGPDRRDQPVRQLDDPEVELQTLDPDSDIPSIPLISGELSDNSR